MSVISSSTSLTPFAQFQECCTSVGLILSSLFEKTDDVFKRISVMKRDENGNIKLYDRFDKTTNQTHKIGVLTYVENVRTGNMYLDEPDYVIAVKCTLIALGMPFYTFGKMCWYACKTPLEITIIALDALSKAFQELVIARFYEFAVELGKGCGKIGSSAADGLYEIVKAPIFGLGAELAALVGIIKPQFGREYEAMIEKAWQKGASYKDDFRNVPARPGEDCWQAFVKDVQDSHPFYLAHCFQVRDNVNNPSVHVIRRQSLY